ncbi:MAG TPA: HEAT repeat domain-containing protein [Spirochaetota bacterium]|nr:HEAT repeat domain-containing protein [Spirochaetota bacterium]
MGLFRPDINKLKKNNKISELVKLLDHIKPAIRYSAFAALAGKADLSVEVKTKLKNMMYTDPDPWVKTIATLRFAELGDPSVSENLIQIINEGTLTNKLELLRLITDNGPTSDVTLFQVIMTGLTDKKVLVRLQAISAANVTKNKQLIPYLGVMLNEKHYKVRLLAAKALYNIGRDESVDYLIGLLADKNKDVHSAARTYLAAINNDRTHRTIDIDTLTQLAESMDGNEPVRDRTTGRIRQDKILRGLAILHEACNDRFRGVRIEALKSIAVFRDQSSVDVVEKLLYDKFPEVRIEALTTLERIGGKRALEAIEKLEGDRKKIVREAIDRTLARMRNPK